jgi:hypothetical protein
MERIRFVAAMEENGRTIGIGPSKEIPHKGRLLIRGTELGPEANGIDAHPKNLPAVGVFLQKFF